MEQGGISQRLVRFAKNLVGHIKGGLGFVVVVCGDLLFRNLGVFHRRCLGHWISSPSLHDPGRISPSQGLLPLWRLPRGWE